jgi:hypothetical protein
MNTRSNLDSELIYASAFIDGEGHIEFKTRPKKNSRGKIYNCKAIRIEVCNTDFKPVEDLQKTFDCGFISYPKRRLRKDGELGKQQIKWCATHKDCYKVGKLILPFLKTTNRINTVKEIINYYEEKSEN